VWQCTRPKRPSVRVQGMDEIQAQITDHLQGMLQTALGSAHRIASLCSGPLRLLDGDFPQRDKMMGIVTWNVSKALDFVH